MKNELDVRMGMPTRPSTPALPSKVMGAVCDLPYLYGLCREAEAKSCRILLYLNKVPSGTARTLARS